MPAVRDALPHVPAPRPASAIETPKVAGAPPVHSPVQPPPLPSVSAGPMPSAAKATGQTPAMLSPAPASARSLDATTVARDLVDRKVRLTFDADNRIDREALLAAKVDAGMIAALQSSPYLAGRVGRQVEQALYEVVMHARAKPTNLIRKGEHVTLGGDAPAELIHLFRFHSRAPRMQERLRHLHDELNMPVDLPAPAPAPIRGPVQSPVQAQVPNDKASQPDNADILHGEAARQAALRAARQRGR